MGAGIATRTIREWRNPLITLDENTSDGKARSWIMIAPLGKFHHERYGVLNFSRSALNDIKKNFDERVRHIDIALDVDHDQGAATGWLEQLEFRDAGSDGNPDTPAGLWGLIRWTPYGEKLIKDETYRYFSPEFAPFKDPQTEKVTDDVLAGGALTNRPFLKTMPSVALSEHDQRQWYRVALSERRQYQTLMLLEQCVERARQFMEVSTKSWASVNKSKLPRSCFLIQGDPDKKDTWKLPVFEGAGPLDADGHYTQKGALNINAVRAALSAIGGARTGTPMSGVGGGVRARLQRWLDQYGKGGSGASKAANERNGFHMATGKRARLGQREDAPNLKMLSQQDDPEDETEEGEEMDDDELESRYFGDGSGKAKGDGDMEGDYADPEDDNSQAYADGEEDDGPAMDDGDGADDGDGGDDGFDKKSNTHLSMKCSDHTHGKYGPHSHNNDADHSDAPLKASTKSAIKQTSERGSGRTPRLVSGDRPLTLAESRRLREEVKALREENAKASYRLYEKDVAETLEGWRKGQTFQFKESSNKSVGGKVKTGIAHIALSKAFRERYTTFMLNEGIRLSERQRNAVNGLVEMALSTAVLDLSQRGSSFDQESRRTIKGGESRFSPDDSDKLQEAAERMALSEEHKHLEDLEPALQMDFYKRAEKVVDYR